MRCCLFFIFMCVSGVAWCRDIYRCPDGSVTDKPSAADCINITSTPSATPGRDAKTVAQEIAEAAAREERDRELERQQDLIRDRQAKILADAAAEKQRQLTDKVEAVARAYDVTPVELFKTAGSGPSRVVVVREKPSQHAIDQCIDGWRPILKDPSSASVVSAWQEIAADIGFEPAKLRLRIDGRAKNSFGALIPSDFTCVFTHSGGVVPER